ncbi:hypothetical protein HDV05_006934 [Chytridiales sp. JEL 0842]|nr:hypothetical protein HDV05_006934 [Chytridiales sp. JEL 0842]
MSTDCDILRTAFPQIQFPPNCCDDSEKIGCSDDGSITRISMPGVNLDMKLPPELASLTSLRILNLERTGLYGEIPNTYDPYLVSDKIIRLAHNRLTGKLPYWTTANTEILDVHNNSLSGELPHYHFRYPRMKVFDISFNQFTGVYEDRTQSMKELRVFRINDNWITGRFPQDLWWIETLEVVDVSNNRMFGTVDNFTSRKLKEFNLENNCFRPTASVDLVTLGTQFPYNTHCKPSEPDNIPLIKPPRKTPNSNKPLYLEPWAPIPSVLESLFANENINSSIPPSLSLFSELSTLNLENTGLSGTITDIFQNLEFLDIVKLAHNKLTGPIPPTLLSRDFISVIDLHNNQLTGTLELILWNFAYIIDLSNNFFRGKLSDTIVGNRNIRMLKLQNNLLSGNPFANITHFETTEVLDLTNNRFGGEIPVMKSSRLRTFNVLNNCFTGIPPTDQSLGFQNPTSDCLIDEDLQPLTPPKRSRPLSYPTSNDYYDYLSSNFRDCELLSSLFPTLNLTSKDVFNPDGTLNEEQSSCCADPRIGCNHLGYITELTLPPFSGLNSTLPDGIGGLRYLQTLRMESAGLFGRIPASFQNLVDLTNVNLGFNNLSGPIPEKMFGDMWNLKSLQLHGNNFTGSLPAMFTYALRMLDLSGNKFAGKIPEEWIQAEQLMELRLGNNFLSGNIGLLSELRGLKSVDLSGNCWVSDDVLGAGVVIGPQRPASQCNPLLTSTFIPEPLVSLAVDAAFTSSTGNGLLSGTSMPAPPPRSTPNVGWPGASDKPSNGTQGASSFLVAGLAIGLSAVVIVILGVTLFIFKRRRNVTKTSGDEMGEDVDMFETCPPPPSLEIQLNLPDDHRPPSYQPQTFIMYHTSTESDPNVEFDNPPLEVNDKGLVNAQRVNRPLGSRLYHWDSASVGHALRGNNVKKSKRVRQVNQQLPHQQTGVSESTRVEANAKMMELNEKSPIEWSVVDVLVWLEFGAGVERATLDLFADKYVDGPQLLGLTNEKLKVEVGVKVYGERARVERQLEMLKKTQLSTTTSFPPTSIETNYTTHTENMNVAAAELAQDARQTTTKGFRIPMMVLILVILLSALIMVVVPLGYISLDSGQKITADLTQRVIEGVVQRAGDSLVAVFGQFAVSMYAAGALPTTPSIVNNYYDNMAASQPNTTLALIRVMERNPVSSAIWTRLRQNLTGTQRASYYFPGFGVTKNPCEFYSGVNAAPNATCYARIWSEPRNADLMGRVVDPIYGNDIAPEMTLIKDNRPFILPIISDYISNVTITKPTWDVIWTAGRFSRYSFVYTFAHVADPRDPYRMTWLTTGYLPCLTNLEALFKELLPSADSSIFLVDDAGFMVASSVNNTVTVNSTLRYTPTSNPDPNLTTVGRFLESQYGAFSNPSLLPNNTFQQANLNGAPYIIATKKIYMPVSNQPFALVVYVPRVDFYGRSDTSFRNAIIISSCLGVTGLILVAIMSYAASIPLKRLAYSMAQLTKFDFTVLENGALEHTSFIAELNQVEGTFLTMVKAFAAAVKKNKELMTTSLGSKTGAVSNLSTGQK